MHSLAPSPLADGCGWLGISLCFHTREADGGTERCGTILIADASLGIWGHYHHGFSPRQTCTQQFVILNKDKQLKTIGVKARACTHGTWLGIM